MKRVPVSSSNIESVGYDAETQTLEIAFLNGSVYEYHFVSAHIMAEFLRLKKSGGSIGQYFNSVVKGSYSFSKIT